VCLTDNGHWDEFMRKVRENPYSSEYVNAACTQNYIEVLNGK
jgi:hypothetical protein